MNIRDLYRQQKTSHLTFWRDDLIARFQQSEHLIPLSGFAHTVQMTFMDGSTCTFVHAFCLHNPSKQAIGIFTEHCGYHTFSSYGSQVIVDNTVFFECDHFG